MLTSSVAFASRNLYLPHIRLQITYRFAIRQELC